MYSLGTPSSLQLSQQEVPDTFSIEPRRVSIYHFPRNPSTPTTTTTTATAAITQAQLHRHPSSSISRRRRRLRRSTRRSCQKSLSKRKASRAIFCSSSPPSPPIPPLPPYPHPPSSPTGGGGDRSSPGSPSCTFSLDGFMEPSLSVVGAPAGLFSYASGTGAHPASNIGIATPTEDSFPFFSPPPYPVATSNSIRLVQRSVTPHSNRRSLHLNINNNNNHHVGHHSPIPLSSNSIHHLQTSSFTSVLGTSPPSSSYPPLPPIFTPRPSLIGLAPTGSMRRAFARRSSNPSSPTFSHHNCNYLYHGS